jgi:hypothetical protein
MDMVIFISTAVWIIGILLLSSFLEDECDNLGTFIFGLISWPLSVPFLSLRYHTKRLLKERKKRKQLHTEQDWNKLFSDKNYFAPLRWAGDDQERLLGAYIVEDHEGRYSLE